MNPCFHFIWNLKLLFVFSKKYFLVIFSRVNVNPVQCCVRGKSTLISEETFVIALEQELNEAFES